LSIFNTEDVDVDRDRDIVGGEEVKMVKEYLKNDVEVGAVFSSTICLDR
jgi:hypothetical protein